MSSLRIHISTSLDGYVAGRHQSEENPLGEGDDPPFHKPVFVLTHHPREPLTLSDTTFTFVADGFEWALEQASQAARGKDVIIGGGAEAVRRRSTSTWRPSSWKRSSCRSFRSCSAAGRVCSRTSTQACGSSSAARSTRPGSRISGTAW
jgi:hypothetical protein